MPETSSIISLTGQCHILRRQIRFHASGNLGMFNVNRLPGEESNVFSVRAARKIVSSFYLDRYATLA
jgi:hypothetical protein